MTQRDLQRLSILCVRVEAFQNRKGHEKDCQAIKDALMNAKNRLLDALREGLGTREKGN